MRCPPDSVVVDCCASDDSRDAVIGERNEECIGLSRNNRKRCNEERVVELSLDGYRRDSCASDNGPYDRAFGSFASRGHGHLFVLSEVFESVSRS